MKASFCSTVITLALLTTLATISYAEKRHHLAHVHGHGLLNMAITEKHIHIELNSPAESLLGFEHHPETEQQHQQVITTNNILKDGEELFRFPQNAECRLLSSHIDNPMAEDDHETAEHHGDEHDSEHNDIRVQYQFKCKEPSHLDTMTTTLFSHFPRFEELDVQLITPQGPKVFELEKAQPNIHLQ